MYVQSQELSLTCIILEHNLETSIVTNQAYYNQLFIIPFQIIRERRSIFILLTLLSVCIQCNSSFDPLSTPDGTLKKAIYLSALEAFLFHFTVAFDVDSIVINEIHTNQPQVNRFTLF